MKQLRVLLCMGLAVVMLLAGSSKVYAVTHMDGCVANLKRVVCGSLVAGNVSVGTHVVGYDINYNPILCTKTAEKHFHTIFCSGCGAVLKSNEVRNCIIKHSMCDPEMNACQY
ncbi:MAG: hypothetical protein ACI4EQ_06095 [Lachnospiraceae bacterium]